jgi:hypothetical protein
MEKQRAIFGWSDQLKTREKRLTVQVALGPFRLPLPQNTVDLALDFSGLAVGEANSTPHSTPAAF